MMTHSDANDYSRSALSHAPAPRVAHIPRALAGERLDKALARLFPDYSRNRLQHWIEAGRVQINGAPARLRQPALESATVVIHPEPAPDVRALTAEPVAMDILYEDEALGIIHKAAGYVVQPAAGNWGGTLLNGVLHRYGQEAAGIPRAGIVHRLDKDTSGVMVIARTLTAYTHLIRQLQARTMKRRYLAFALGTLARQEGAIDAPLGRHPRNRIQHAVVTGAAGKPARTHYRVLAMANKAGPSISAVQCDLETGRTHQIRVHLAHLGHPLIGDPVYGDARARHCAASFTRQTLHAVRLELTHPLTGQRCIWSAPLPEDMAMLAQTLGLPPALATLHLSDQTPKTNREVNGL